ncbi:1-acyl-sn-glycerol-3-phosphate acyltransferase [Wenyingzhuangia sp. 2_MG-2023]|uniref:lysophospholipid acyltransferase family protein n=1 Tax=Wenyingzhuangia sp. 2_MG-2023 TaxID=3062639 RepID=UPI0026E17E6E|nr:lysophospholipid acyltransferase family protein [Wenyingzhuangia sp. 2_MG-2023]MDO6736764.1 lysophospholipid acyltransferase family protein [Wenyingzhuangia sp. 2_MG-2023]MDO6800941.1 lysophospholipid acyltransferase family protein [Wenyingzhuangia sp. 1_MG-2023]
MSKHKKMPLGKSLLAYPLSVLFYFVYALLLCIFHPIQWLSLKIFGYNGHKKSVDVLNFCLTKSLCILGTHVKFINKYSFDDSVPHIIVSNHQSTHEIPPLGWYFRKLHPKFVAKKELGKGIPSVSFNLNHGGSVLIDRSDARQALTTIGAFAKYLQKNNRAGVIFPEGTRSRDGKPKRFSENGLKILTKFAPSATVIPVTVNNSWKLWEYGQFPMNIGVKLTIETHSPIKVSDKNFDELFAEIETSVKSKII